MRSTELPPSLCLFCGYPAELASSLVGNHKPRPGDITLCLSCAAVMRFDSAMRLAPIGDLDLSRELTPPKLEQLRTAQYFIRRRGPIVKHGRAH